MVAPVMSEKIRKTFFTPYSDYGDRNGQSFKVIEKITEPNEDFDAEVLPMYRIEFPDGIQIDAHADEVEEGGFPGLSQ